MLSFLLLSFASTYICALYLDNSLLAAGLDFKTPKHFKTEWEGP